jgi:hypothetical protein
LAAGGPEGLHYTCDAMTRADWIWRPILWFTTASTIHVILHESAHALMAFALGVPTTLYQYWVDWPPGAATLAQEAAIRAWGPAFSLIAGMCFWLAYRKRARTAAGLPLLYLSAIGVAMFFGNLMSAAFVGDFSAVSRWLELPTAARWALSALGAAGVAAIMFWLGRELRWWIPDKPGRAFGVVAVTVLPVLVGTGVIILINQPVPASLHFTTARISEQSFAVFTVIGAVTGTRPRVEGRSFRLRWIDGTIMVAAFLVVRIMVFGVHLRP